MIYKSYLIEENIDLLKNNLVLFYGENLGLKNDLKDNIREKFKKPKILKYTQEDVLKNYDTFIGEIRNISLFEDQKIFFIDNVNDKILNTVKEIISFIGNNKIFLFAEILEKKSKLRSFFEKSKNLDIVPCYKDNEIDLKKIITKKLNGYTGVNTQLVNILIENTSMQRAKLNNEIEKIKVLFKNKIIQTNLLEKLLDLKVDEDFNAVKESALNGQNSITNKLLSTTLFENEKNIFYLITINQRLNKLREIASLANKKDPTSVINNLKPSIFWKDKPNYIIQAKKWDDSKLKKALEKTYNTEIKIKSNSGINTNILIKKLLIDVCYIANA